MWKTTVVGEVETADPDVMRRLLYAAGFPLLLALFAPSAIPAPPCGESTFHPWSLDAPEQLTSDRVGSVSVDQGRSGERVFGARLDYVDANGQAFFSHTFSAAEIASEKKLRFPIRLGADSGQVVVRLTTTVMGAFRQPDPPGYFYARCDAVAEASARPFPGLVPDVQLFGHDDWIQDPQAAVLDLGVEPICELIAAGEFRVLVSFQGRRRALVLRLDPQCPSTADDRFYKPGFSWGRSGQVSPGLHFRPAGNEGLGIDGVGRRNWMRVYRFDAFWNDQRTLRRWLRVRHRYEGARRVYEDSDNFEEQCSETSREEGPAIGRDKHGRYCVLPGHHWIRSRVLSGPPKPRRR